MARTVGALARNAGRMGRRRAGAAALLAVTICCLAPSLAPSLARGADDPRDAAFLAPVLQQALETARTSVETPWRNPATGHSGHILVERTFYREPGTPCRAYIRTLEPPIGALQMTSGTGCRSSTGVWLIEEEATTVAAAPPAAATPAPETPAPVAAAAAEPGPTCPDTVLVPLPAVRPPALAYTLPSRAEL